MNAAFFLVPVITLLLLGCKERPGKTIDIPRSNLTLEEANYRKDQISDISYRLYFDINKQNNQYTGRSEITFQYNGKGNTLRLDFYNGIIDSITLNDQPVDYDYNNAFISIDTHQLITGRNRISIAFKHNYSNDGSGLYKYTDPEDGHVYLYTHLEPFNANTVYPGFDQPNLKASYEMQVMADADWQVITSVRENTIEEIEADRYLWTFPKSHTFSTYIWSLHAGPYALWEDTEFRYPLRLFARQSLAQYIEPNDWFDWSRQCFDFFDRYFAYPYPYNKYDQIIAPDLNTKAMPNVAAVTIAERLISRGKMKTDQRVKLAAIIAGEIAHMWLGNLVTINWWDNLWLQESFARLMAPVALSSMPEFKALAWNDFFLTKSGSYWNDQQLLSHPVQQPVKDTNQAMSVSDGITYGKGSASLKQLMHALTEKEFQDGIRRYIKVQAGKNTDLDDFIKALSASSPEKLAHWVDSWLKTAGVNQLIVDLLCEKGMVSSLVIHQTAPPVYPLTRHHSVLLGFLQPVNNKLEITDTLNVDISGPLTEVTSATGMTCPYILYPNYQDFGYFKITLDQTSIENLMRSITLVADPLLRLQLWHTLSEMMMDNSITLDQYARMLIDALPREKNPMVLKNLLTKIHGNKDHSYSIIYYLGRQSQKAKQAFMAEFEPLLWQQLENADAGSDNQLYWFNALTKSIESPDGLNALASLMNDRHPYSGLTVDQDMRWKIIIRLSQYGHKSASRLINHEARIDRSLKGTQSTLAARSALPNKKLKQILLQQAIKRDSTFSLAEKKAILNNLFPLIQNSDRQIFATIFFQKLDRLITNNRSPLLIEAFTALAPHDCRMGTLSGQYLENNKKNIPWNITKKLMKNQIENSRCASIISTNN